MIPEYVASISAKLGQEEVTKLEAIKRLTGMTTSEVVRHLLKSAMVPVMAKEQGQGQQERETEHA